MISIESYQPARESSSGSPDYLEKQLLAAPAGEGCRHEEIIKLSLQMIGEGRSKEETFRILRDRYPKETSGKRDGELLRAIDGAVKRNPQPASTSKRNGYAPHYSRGNGSSSTIKRLELNPSTEKITVPQVECSKLEFLNRVFRPDETICICVEAFKPDGSEKWIPANAGVFGPLKTMQEPGNLLDPNGTLYYEREAGVWVRINPLKSGDESGKDSSVSSFRHVLVEFDGRPKEEQWEIFRQSKLPIAAVLDSGGKSLHAWVRVDANSLEQYRERQQRIYDYLAPYLDDTGNKNPSRFSRLPGIQRGDNEQHVVAFSIGAGSWDEWEDEHQDY